ncbi:hypothetical protein VZH09_04320 [Synechococcus elongatus IITB7]|uniref:hypothetical protein n=1 Tax=Synechococcus elongatus TaxID=32046 RepID=UPI0030D20229
MMLRSIAHTLLPTLGISLGVLLPAIAQTPPAATPPTPPAQPPQIRELARTPSKCYIGRDPASLTPYDCEIVAIYTSKQPYPSGVQIKWSYGGLSDFSRSQTGEWRWYDPTGKRWLDTQPTWLELEASGCFRFGNMCFGRGFPIVPEMKATTPSANPPKAAPPAEQPRGTSTPAT